MQPYRPFKKPDRDGLILRYWSTNRFFSSCVEKGASLVKLVRRRAALDARVVIIGIIMDSDLSTIEELYPYVPDDRYTLTACQCLDQTGHSVFEIREGKAFRAGLRV